MPFFEISRDTLLVPSDQKKISLCETHLKRTSFDSYYCDKELLMGDTVSTTNIKKLELMTYATKNELDGPMRTICDTIEYNVDKILRTWKHDDISGAEDLYNYIADELPTWETFLRSPSHPKIAFRVLDMGDGLGTSAGIRAAQIRERLADHFRDFPSCAVLDLRDGDCIFHDDELLCIDHIARWGDSQFLISVLRRQDGSSLGLSFREQEEVTLVTPAGNGGGDQNDGLISKLHSA